MSARAGIQATDYQVLQAAAEWFAVLHDPGVSAAERQRWQAWLEAREEHRRAWQQVEAVSRSFASLPRAGQFGEAARLAVEAGSRQRRMQRRQAMKALVLFAAVGGMAWGGRRLGLWPGEAADFETARGETQEVQLADGTRVWLNTDSAISVHFQAGERRLGLLRGEVLVETGKGEPGVDAAASPRPLRLATPEGLLQPLGTRFLVRRDEDAGTGESLAVFAGAVEITPHGQPGARQVIAAGQEVRYDRNGVTTPVPAQAARQAWSRGMLVADDMRLGDFLAELSRYRSGHLGWDPAVAELRLVGAFPLGDTDRILASLEESLPLRVRRTLPWWVSVEPR